MAWQCFQLTYELLSPLHIGCHKVGNLQRTRYYIPARNLWGAVTEALTRRGSSTNGAPQGSYAKIGEWVQDHCAFSYFYILENEQLLAPAYINGDLHYGNYPVAEFERRYLDSLVSTALSPQSTSAESGSLHEVEFISPHPLDVNSAGKRTRLRGQVFLDEEAQKYVEEIKKAMESMRLGGERRYGFGRLRISDNGWEEVREMGDCPARLDSKRPQIQVAGGRPLLAHTLAQGVRARGMIEPLVGRETGKDSRSFGQALTQARVCWMPGSVAEQEGWLTLDKVGIWCAYNS